MADVLSVQEHYERHLASIYAWSLGDTNAAVARARQQLAVAGIPHGAGATAVDLGCGFGLYAIPLTDLGYRVMPIDQSSELHRLGLVMTHRSAACGMTILIAQKTS